MPRRSRALFVGLICLFGGAGYGCSSGSDSDDGAPVGAGQMAGASQAGTSQAGADPAPAEQGGGDALRGRWEQCGSLTNTYSFADGRFEQFISYHDTDDCSGEPRRSEGAFPPDRPFTAGSYRLLGTVTTEEGLEAQAIDMTTDMIQGGTVFESIRVTRYDIVYTGTAGQLVFSPFAGYTAEERPFALNFERPFLAK